jgi:hypothetical protein
MGSKLKLKIAVAVIDRIVPCWQAALISAARNVAGVEVTVIRLRPDPELRQPVAPSVMNLDSADYRVTRRLTSVADPLKKVFIESPIQTANFRKDYFDLVIDLAGNIAAARGLIPRRAVWSPAFGKHFRLHDNYPCLEEVLAGDEVTTTALIERGMGGDSPQIMRAAYTAVDPHSIFVTRAQALWAAAQLVAAALRDVGLAADLPARPLPREVREKDRPALAVSGERAFQFAISGLRHAWRGLWWRDEWRVHFKTGSGADFRKADPAEFTVLPSPKGGFLADPFGVEHSGRTVIFAEEYPYSTRRGVISWVELKDGVPQASPQAALTKPHHLSYPFLIEDEGALYMIPESSAAGTVELYKCHAFPGDWRLEATLLKGLKAVDTTIARVQDKLWMFTAVKRPETRNFDELHLYSADQLTGPWTPHPRNPVRFDARDSRPAGALFKLGDAWIRPAQDGTVRYGRQVKFQRITKLSLTEYSEETLTILSPEMLPGIEGVHTWNQSANLALFDSVRGVFKFRPYLPVAFVRDRNKLRMNNN